MVLELINMIHDLLELHRLHRKNHRSRTVQILIQHSLVAGSVPCRWLNASLLGSVPRSWLIFWPKNRKNTKSWASYMPLRASSVWPHHPGQYICIRRLACTWRSWLNFSNCLFPFFSFKNWASSMPSSWSDVFELVRCCWGSPFHFGKPANSSQCGARFCPRWFVQ